MHTMTEKAKAKAKTPAGPYMNDHNWPMHMLCHLVIETLHPVKQGTCRSVPKDISTVLCQTNKIILFHY